MSERRQSDAEGGRRNGDQWLGRAVKIVALVAALVTTMGFMLRGTQAVSLAEATSIRVDTLGVRLVRQEEATVAMSYMTCVNFTETHPVKLVPKYCDSFTSTRR